MKNFKHSFKTQLALAFVLLSASIGHAQVVTVPPNCTVVLAGTGGTVGAGGKVGNGGLVSMPDQLSASPYTPNQGGNFLFNQPSGVTTASWQLKGDLSYKKTQSSVMVTIIPNPPITVTGNFNAASNPPAGLTADIWSYNKTFRSSEYLAPSNVNWARSNGRVTVSWDEGTCGKSMYFDVCKKFTNSTGSTVPAIVGPTCLKPNTVYTYSVDKIVSDNVNDAIGFDSYYWSGIPLAYYQNNNPDFYTSADGSSITFKTGATVYPITLQCCYGRVNPTTINVDGGPSFFLNTPIGTHTTCVSQNLILEPTAPTYVTAPPTCHPTGTASFNIVYPNIPVTTPLTTYAWTAPNTGWTIGAPVVGATNTTVTVTTPNNNPGALTLIINGPCLPVVINYQINRSLTGSIIAPVTTSTGSTCMLAGSSNNQFNLGGASANNTTWTLTTSPIAGSGVTLASVLGQPSSTIAVNIASNATINTTYTLTATANTVPACNATSATYTFNVKPLTPTISPASGSSACVVKGALTAQTYNCTASTGASYVWSFPAGWSASSFTTTTNSITVTPSSTTAVLNGNATVTATGLNSCDSVLSANFPISYQPIIPSAITFSNSCFNFGLPTSGTITVTNVPSPFYGTYTVTSTPAGLFSSYSVNATTGLISFTTTATASGSYTLIIKHDTTALTPNCGTAQNAVGFPVTVAGNGATITTAVDPTPATPGGCDTYNVTGAPAGSAIQWFLNGSTTPLASNTTTIFIQPNGLQLQLCGAITTNTSVCAQVTFGGCTTRVCAPSVGTHGTARLSSPKLKGVTIFPNPSDGNFTIQADNVKENATATLTDMSGKRLGIYTLSKGENKIKTKNLSSGTYIVILQIDGKTESRQLIVK